MGVDDNVATVRSFYEAGAADDDVAWPPFVSEDIVWHVPGENPVAGTYRGIAEVFGTIGAGCNRSTTGAWRWSI